MAVGSVLSAGIITASAVQAETKFAYIDREYWAHKYVCNNQNGEEEESVTFTTETPLHYESNVFYKDTEDFLQKNQQFLSI